MIKNSKKVEQFNRKLIKEKRLSYAESLKIFEGLYREALRLNVINSKNILDGIDIDIKLAKALNSLK